mgnify:CR=1 FL=1
MNEPDDSLFEAQLRRLKPTPLPDALRHRLEAALSPAARAQPTSTRAARLRPVVPGWLRWLAPVAAAAAGVALLLTQSDRVMRYAQPERVSQLAATDPAQVVIDRQLMETFDAVATLPGGEPVRFRCRRWLEAVTLRNPADGWEVEQRLPRLEITPVCLEIY